MRPTPGSLIAGGDRSIPAVRPSRLTSTPSSGATRRPRRPPKVSCKPLPLGGSGPGRPGRIVLADGGGWQIQRELRHRSPDVGGEGVAVGARPDRVATGVRVIPGRVVDSVDQPVHLLATADFAQQKRPAAKPVLIGRSGADPDALVAPAKGEAHDLHPLVEAFVRPLRGDPGVNAKRAPPADRPGGVDLDDGVPGGGGSGAWALLSRRCDHQGTVRSWSR